jgi:hypothetical protein
VLQRAFIWAAMSALQLACQYTVMSWGGASG